MIPFYKDSAVTLYHGECLDALRSMPDNCVDSIVTDPPYGLKFMGKKWDYDVPAVEVWAECLRVLKPGGYLLAFSGTRTQHRMAVRIEDAGFEIRDMLAWVYGSGFPKSLDVSKALDAKAGAVREDQGVSPNWRESKRDNGQSMGAMNGENCGRITTPATDAAKEWDGWGTALKPALEPITMARKPLIGTVAENILTHGTGGINVDGCRVPGESEGPGTTPRSSVNGTRASMAGSMDRTEYDGSKGRWPANLIHDGSPEVLDLFPHTKSGKPGVHRLGENTGAAYGAESRAPGTPQTGFGDEGSASRFFYCAKASKADRDDGIQGTAAMAGEMTGGRAEGSAGLDNPRAGAGRTGGGKNTHATVKPLDLMRYLVRMVTRRGGVTLDPFMGSGSTGRGAVLEGVEFIGMERERESVLIAMIRILHTRQNGAHK